MGGKPRKHPDYAYCGWGGGCGRLAIGWFGVPSSIDSAMIVNRFCAEHLKEAQPDPGVDMILGIRSEPPRRLLGHPLPPLPGERDG